MRDLLDAAAGHAAAYLESLPERPVGAPRRFGRTRARRLRAEPARRARGPAPGARRARRGCRRRGSPRWARRATSASSSAARFRRPSPPTGWRRPGTRTPGLASPTPAVAAIEEITGAWVLDLLGLPDDASFAFVTGCQMAHVTALAAARHRVLADAGWDVERDGLDRARPPVRVLVGAGAPRDRRPGAAPPRARHRVHRARAGRPARRDARGRARARAARAGRPHARVRPGRQRQHRAVDPLGRDLRRRAQAGAGCTWTARSGSGRAPARGTAAPERLRAARLVGHRRAQVAERALRLRHRGRRRPRRPPARDGGPGELPPAGRARARADGLEPGVLAPGALAAGLRGAALARAQRRRRAGRPALRLRRALRRPARRASPGVEVLAHGLNQVLVRPRGRRRASRPRSSRGSSATARAGPSATTWRGERCMRISVCNWQTTLRGRGPLARRDAPGAIGQASAAQLRAARRTPLATRRRACAACSSPSRESTARGRPPRRGCSCEALGDDAVGVREPGGTELGERVRDLLKDPRLELGPAAEALLFAAARAELVDARDPPGARARAGSWSPTASSTARSPTRASARGLGVEEVERVNRFATGGLRARPDLPARARPGRRRRARRHARPLRGRGRSPSSAAVADAYERLADGGPRALAAHRRRRSPRGRPRRRAGGGGGRAQRSAGMSVAARCPAPRTTRRRGWCWPPRSRARPRTPTSSTAPPAPARAPPRAPSRPSCWPRAPTIRSRCATAWRTARTPT